MTTVEQPTRSRVRSVGVSTRSDTPSTMKQSEHDTRAKSRRHHRSVARHRRATVESLSAHRLSGMTDAEVRARKIDVVVVYKVAPPDAVACRFRTPMWCRSWRALSGWQAAGQRPTA